MRDEFTAALRGLSLARQLAAICAVTSTAALLVASAALIAYDVERSREPTVAVNEHIVSAIVRPILLDREAIGVVSVESDLAELRSRAAGFIQIIGLVLIGALGMAAIVPSPVEPKRVLLAEDNVVNQRVASGLLNKRGHRVTIVENGRQALDALERETFDLVLMDLQMPVMGGLDATAAIRERERRTGGHVRIVAMTAHAMSGDRDRCLAAGMDDYLSKPIDQALLFEAVEQSAGAAAAPGAARPPAVNLAQALERLGGDRQLLSDVVGIFLEDCPRQLAAVKLAVDARDADAIRRAAHALKGAAGNLAATDVFEAAQTLERIGAERRLDAADAGWRRLSAAAAQLLDTLRRVEGTAV